MGLTYTCPGARSEKWSRPWLAGWDRLVGVWDSKAVSQSVSSSDNNSSEHSHWLEGLPVESANTDGLFEGIVGEREGSDGREDGR